MARKVKEYDEQENISRVLKMLLGGIGMKPVQLAPRMEMSTSALYAKINHETKWSTGDLMKLSRILDVDPGAFLDPRTFASPRGTNIDLSAIIPGEAEPSRGAA